MNSFKAGACAVVVVVAFGVAGCGGSDSSSDNSTTKAEFVTQANAICADSNKKIVASQKEAFSSGQQPTKTELDAYISDTLLPEVDTQLTQLRDLSVPSGEEDQVNAFLDAADSALEDAKTDPSLIANSDPFAEANKLATEYGLNECAS